MQQNDKDHVAGQRQSGQMGNNLLAYVAMQSGQFHQSISKNQQQLEQNFGLSFSRGAISEAQGRVISEATKIAECGRYPHRHCLAL